MFEQPAVRVHQLNYSVRGPEWAFAIPQGDENALEEVMRICSEFWNGIGSLIVPVRADGRLYPALDGLLETRDVDTVLLHESLDRRAVSAVRERFARTGSLYDGLTRHEIHPLFLAANAPEPVAPLWRPRFPTKRLRRIALAVWGHIDEEDESEWDSRFTLHAAEGELAHRHMLASQIAGNTPLRLGGLHMPTIEQSGPDGWRHLFVFERGSFEELVYFWNLRSRLSTWNGQSEILAVTTDSLGPGELQPVREWAEGPYAGSYYKPDLCLAGPERAMPAAKKAVEALGFHHAKEPHRFRHSFPDPPKGQEGLEYTEFPIGVGGPLRRGSTSTALVTVSDQRALLNLPRPASPQLPFGYVRLAIRGLPLPLPLNAETAKNLIPNAEVSQDGLTVTTDSGSRQWSWEIELPTPPEALDQWAGSAGYQVAVSQPGKYAQALLGRLPGPKSLDSLASEVALEVFAALAPQSARKMAQRLVGELKARGQDLPVEEARIYEYLLDGDILPGAEAKTVNEIAARTGRSQADHLEALVALVRAGLARRGVALRCDQCNFPQLFPVDELDETVGCQACRKRLALPVARGGGEYPISYFLDGLAARLADQGLLPVLLALRRAWIDNGEGKPFFAWPGLLLRKGDLETDVDLLVSDGERASVFECKTSAESLSRQQTDKLLDVAADLGARPALAAANGRFSDDIVTAVDGASGIVFQRQDLLVS